MANEKIQAILVRSFGNKALTLCSMNFSVNLQAVMTWRGVDQSELARRLGITASAVNQWIAGTTEPRGKRLKRIADALGVEVTALVSGHGGPLTAVLDPQPHTNEFVGANLRAARQAYNEDTAQVARALGITKRLLEAYESGRTNFPRDLMIKFCDLTGCTTDWILRRKMDVRMPTIMAARIGHLYPHLIEGLDRELAETAGADQR